MKRALVLGFVSLLVVSATGCGGGPDALMKELIANMNDMATAIEKKESEEKIKAIQERMKATEEKLNKLNLSDEEKKKLVEKHKGELEAAAKRLGQAMMGQMSEKFGEMMKGGMPGMPGMPGGPGGMPGMPGMPGGAGMPKMPDGKQP